MIGLLLCALIVCLLFSVPVAFAIGISAMIYLLDAGYPPLSIVAQRMVEGVDSFPLMALPLFVLSGELMAKSCTPRLMALANLLIGRVPGGLGAAASIGCGFFGAISGSGVATTAAIGGIMAPEMVRKGYGPGFTASLVAGAGVLGMVIPPSFCMVIYGATGGVSIGNLFLSGFIPGFMAVFALIAYSIGIGAHRGYRSEAAHPSRDEKVRIVTRALLPLVMPVLILGGVLSGLVTPTESAMIAVLYALFLEVCVYHEMTRHDLVRICVNSAVSSAVIMFIMAAAAPFGWIMATENVPKLFADMVLSVSTTPTVVFLLIMGLLLFLGTFMEGVSVIILLTPIFMPIMANLGMDPVHFGVAMMLAIAIGGVTPPLAVGLFVSTRIINIKVEDTFPEVLHVVGILVATLALVSLFPQISLFLPQLFGK